MIFNSLKLGKGGSYVKAQCHVLSYMLTDIFTVNKTFLDERHMILFE